MRIPPHALTTAAAQALYVGAWTAAGELSPAKRRLARVGIVAGAYALTPTDPEPEPAGPATPAPSWKGKPVTLAVTGLLLLTGRHQLHHFWLARLTRSGHPHPHVALAVRMSAASFAITLLEQTLKND